MPPVEDKTVVDAGKAPDATPPKKKSRLPLILILAGVCLAAGIGGAFMFLGGGSDSAAGSEDGHDTAKKEEKSKGHGDKGSSGPIVYTIEDIVVNPAGTGGARFLSVSFGFELNSPSLATQFEQREPLVRDALITILSSKTVAQLTDVKQKEIMRLQVKKRLTQLLQTEDLAAVYYTDFVLQ
jgi:flagellar FliL protein